MLKFIKEKLKLAKHRFALIYFCIIMIIFLPGALTLPSHSFRSAIVTAVGIDKIDDEFEVCFLTLSDIDKTNMCENTKLISGKGKSVANAIVKIETQVGRKIRMGHVGYVVISKEVAKMNIVEILNTLILTSKLPNTVSLVMTNSKSKDLLKEGNQLEQSSSFKLREIIHNEFNETFTKDTNIDKFLQGYLSPTGISTLGVVELEDSDAMGIDAGGGSSNATSQGQNDTHETSGDQSKSNKPSVIHFKNEHAVFQNGKFKFMLTQEEMDGINWLVENDIKKIFTIHNVNSQGFNNATISFEVVRQKVNSKAHFKNGIPTVKFDLSIVIDIAEILDETQLGESLKEFVLTDDIMQTIQFQIKKEVAYSINSLRQKNADVVGVYKILYKDYKNFVDFFDKLSNKNEFLKDVKFELQIYCQLVSNK